MTRSRTCSLVVRGNILAFKLTSCHLNYNKTILVLFYTSGGELIERDGKKYKIFYGMSSCTAMQKHSGGVANYRSVSCQGVTIVSLVIKTAN